MTNNHQAGELTRSRSGTRRRGATATAPITILHVHGRMARGGAEMRTVDVFRHIDRRRYRFHFCCLSGLCGQLDEEILALGGQVHRMRQSRIGFPRRFRDLLRRWQFDVVHCHLHFYSGYILKLAAECGTGVRVAHFRSSRADGASTARRTLHGLMRLCMARYAGQSTMRRWMDRHATHILGVSRSALASTWGPGWRSDPRCRVVYDGLETAAYRGEPDDRGVRRELGLPDDAPLFVHVGRFTEAKNHVRLISMFWEIIRRQPAARLLLIGRTVAGGADDTILRRVRQRIAELGMADRVVLAGERGDVPRLMKAADVLLFPSLWEGLGDVVLEACAAGTPVLASDLPSIREIADRLPGVRRLSLAEGDAAWAHAALQTAVDRPSGAQRRAAWDRFTNSVFTVGHCTQALGQIWQGCGRGLQAGRSC